MEEAVAEEEDHPVEGVDAAEAVEVSAVAEEALEVDVAVAEEAAVVDVAVVEEEAAVEDVVVAVEEEWLVEPR